MATHSNVLAWRMEPGGLPSMGSHRVRHDWSDLATAAASEIYPSLENKIMFLDLDYKDIYIYNVQSLTALSWLSEDTVSKKRVTEW